MIQAHRLSKFILPAVILISAFLGFLRFNSLQVGTSHDDAHYMILAESLSSGQGYQLINFPRPQIERAFPPGWPILLSPLTFLFPGNYAILKLLTLALWLTSLILMYKFFSKRIETPYLEILIGVIAINPLLVGTSVTVMSESAYLLFSLVVLTLFDSWHNKTESTNYWLIILIAFFALYAQLIRTVGISIFAALIIYFIFSRHFREAGITLGVFSAGAILQTWLNLRNGGSVISAGYESQVFNSSVIEKIGQMWTNLLGYFNETLASSLVPMFGEKVISLAGSEILLLANTIIILLTILGLIFSLKKFQLMDIYFSIYILAILAFWNPRVGSVKVRFLIPIIPFLYFYLIQGTRWGVNKFARGISFNSAKIMAGLTVIIVLLLLTRNLQDWQNPVKNQMTDISIGADWISQHAPANAIVMVEDPVPAYIYVRRKTIAYPSTDQNLEAYLNNQDINYIVISPKLQSPRSTILDEFTEKQILPILNSKPEEFLIVYENLENNVKVYQHIK